MLHRLRGISFTGYVGFVAEAIWAAGRQIQREPGNQVSTKYISSSKSFVRIHALPRIDRVSLTVGCEVTKQFNFTKPQLARESSYLGQNIGQGSEVPTKQNIFSHPGPDLHSL